MGDDCDTWTAAYGLCGHQYRRDNPSATGFGSNRQASRWAPAWQSLKPINLIRDSASGEMKGVGFDLGRELAQRIGVPFEPVLYPSVGVLLDSGKSGAWDVAFVGFSPERARSGISARCTWKSNSATLSLAVLPSQQWLMWIAPGFELPCRRGPARMFFFSHAKKCCGDPSIKQPWRIGGGEIRESRRNGQHQANPVRAVE